MIGVISVLMAGAIGDGVTDDTAAIQRAIDIGATSGRRVYFPRLDPETPAIYRVTAPLVLSNNSYLFGDGGDFISGAVIAGTTILDDRVNPATPLFDFKGDVLGLPFDRGCTIEYMNLHFPSNAKTNYSIIIATAGLLFNHVSFRWALSGADPDPGPIDPGGIRFLAFEQVVFDCCQFHGGSTHLSFLGSGAGGPCSLRNCWFYDCKDEWILFDSNGDHDFRLEGCAFDPLYRTTNPVVGVDIRANGFTVENCSFYGNAPQQPSGAYLKVTGTGSVRNCQMVINPSTAPRPVGIYLDSCSLLVENCKINAYNPINNPGAGSTLITRGNTFIATQMPDQLASSPMFRRKRGVIVNYTYAGPCQVDLGPDTFVASFGAAVAIVDASFSTPIVIETAADAFSPTGETVQVFGVTGNTAANGYWELNQIDPTHYELIGSVGNAAFTGGGTATPYYKFQESYYIGGDDGGPSYTQFTNGVIHWDKQFDQSGYVNTDPAELTLGLLISGNPKLGGLVRLDTLAPMVIVKGTGQTMRHADGNRNLITNEQYISNVAYFLPEITGGQSYTFEKRPDVVTAGNPAPEMKITTKPTVVDLVGVSNTTPIVAETSLLHPFSTGDQVTIAGNAAANGTWTVTRIDTTHFSLDTSVAAGAVAGGTASRKAYIMLPGSKFGTTSVSNANTSQYGARLSLQARFQYVPATERDELRWFVVEREGDWFDAEAAP